MKRLFIGVKINPTEKMIELIDSIKLELRQENIRWVKPENYHITLKFFGDTDGNQMKKIILNLEGIKFKSKKFNMKSGGIGTFTRDGNPKIIWIDTFENEGLYKLEKEIAESIEKIGYSKEKRPFKSHLTIGSVRDLKDRKIFNKVLENYKDIFIQDNEVNEYILFESILKPGGPIYNELHSFELL